MSMLEAPGSPSRSVLVTPQEMSSASFADDAIVLVVSTDCIAAVDAARQAKGRHGVFIGDASSPALHEMRSELYDPH